MVKIVTNFENGVQIEEAPNSLRTIAPYVDVSLYGLTASGAAFYEISFARKMYGDIVKKVIPTSLLLSNRELICFLVSNGYANVPLKEDEKILCDFLRERGNKTANALFVEKLGWLDDELARKNKQPYVYVTPDKQYSEVNSDLQIRYVENPNVYSQNMETAGKLKDWVDNIGIYVQHSPLLTMAVCMGLGAIAMKPCGIESFMIHIWAVTSKGKTITELVGQSLYRKAEKNTLPTWDITKIGLMDKCSSFSDTLFILDEVTKFCDTPTKLQQMIYEATNGSGKITSFAYAKSVSRVDCHWTIPILSSGEKSITQILKEGNVKLLKGREVRCFEINALRYPKYFIFTSLPKKMKDSAKLAKRLEENARLYYGTPARKFLKEFLKEPKEYVKRIQRRMKKFFEEQGLEEGDIKGRIANRFAFMEAIGLSAVDFEILPMKKSKVKEYIRLLCGEVLAQHKTDDELQTEGRKLLKKALKREYLVTVKQKGKKFSDDEKMAFGFKIMRDSFPNRHFIAIRKSQFDSVFTSQYQADLVTRYLKESGILTHKQVDFVDFGERPQFHCLNLEKLRKEGFYK